MVPPGPRRIARAALQILADRMDTLTAERPVAVEVEADAEERRALLERVRGGGLQIVAERHERATPLLARDPAHAELHLRDALGDELAEDDHFVQIGRAHV